MSPLSGTDPNNPAFLKALEDWKGTYENDPNKEMFPSDWYTNPSKYAGVDPSIYNRQTYGGDTMEAGVDTSNFYDATKPLKGGGGSFGLRDYNQFMQKNRVGPNSRLSYSDFMASPGSYVNSSVGGGSDGAGAVGGVTGQINSGQVPYTQLADILNKFMTQQAKLPYVYNLPNYENMLTTATGNAQDQLLGNVSRGTTNAIAQAAAERGIASGGPASPSNNAAYLKALGLTSEQLQQQGQANLHQLISDTPVPELFNPASLFVPQMLAELELAARKQGERLSPTVRSGGGWNPYGGYQSSPSYTQTDPRFRSGQEPNFGFTPNNRDNSWNLPSQVLPQFGGDYGGDYSEMYGSGGELNYNDLYAQPGGGGFGDWSNMDAGNYVMAQDQSYWDSGGIPQYDYGQMYSDAGADFTDWSLSDVDWSVYE